jgi:hypothetical protein
LDAELAGDQTRGSGSAALSHDHKQLFQMASAEFKSGKIELPPFETLRHGFGPMIKRISELCRGLEWMR